MRLTIVAAALGVALITGVAGLILVPALDGDDDKAEAEVRTWRWCDVEIDLPEGVYALPVVDDVGAFPPGSIELRPADRREQPILISGEDGAVLAQPAFSAAQQSSSDAVFAAANTFRKVSDPPDVWPYTDEVAVTDFAADFAAEIAAVAGVEHKHGWRPPDPASGMRVGSVSGDTAVGSVEGLRVETCHSVMWIYDGVADMSQVQPEDREAFERFAAEVD